MVVARLLELLLPAHIGSEPEGARALLPGGGGVVEKCGERPFWYLICRRYTQAEYHLVGVRVQKAAWLH